MAQYKYLDSGLIVDTRPDRLDIERECRRVSTYYSPTQLKMFERDRREYIRRYIYGAGGIEQTPAMAIGGAFDCFVKGAIAQEFGVAFDLDANLRRAIQVDKLWDAVRADAETLFGEYVSSGQLDRLILDMWDNDVQVDTIEMEQKRTFDIGGGVIVLGIPDLTYVGADGVRVVLDWKVNGRYSAKGGTVLTNFVNAYPPTKMSSSNGAHKKVMRGKISGMWCDVEGLRCKAHNDQLSTYGLAFGDSEIIGWIEQVCCTPDEGRRFVVVRGRLNCTAVKERYKHMHEVLSSGHMFDSLARSESDSLMADIWVEVCAEANTAFPGLL